MHTKPSPLPQLVPNWKGSFLLVVLRCEYDLVSISIGHLRGSVMATSRPCLAFVRTATYRVFSDYLESLSLCKEQQLITGDFNIHTDKSHKLKDPISSIFLNLLESFNLQQHVTMRSVEENEVFCSTRDSAINLHVFSTASLWLL